MNFARDVVEAAPPERLAMVELARDGARREWRFGEVAEQAGLLAAHLGAHGARRGDVVLTLLGNRPEWVLAMVACFRAGYAVLPCTEQLRPKDLRLRLDGHRPALVIADERNRDALEAAGWDGPTVWAPWGELPRRDVPPPAELDARDPCLVAFTSGTSGEPKAVLHGQGYLPGQRLQAEHWLAARDGRPRLVHGRLGLVEVRAQRVHRAVAARRRGAAARRPLRPRRAARHRRARGRERPLHGADGVPRDRQPRAAAADRLAARPRRRRRGARPRGARRLARGDRPVDPRRLRADGDRPAHRPPAGRARRGRARWAARCRASALTVVDGELTLDPATDPTFFLRYLGEAPHTGPWRTGDLVRADEDGYLYFESRADDVIVSAGYRIGPFEVESALVAHPAVAEAAAVSAPDRERGAVVRAIVVLQRRPRALRRARARAAGPRQGRDRAVQVPAHRRVRRRAAAHQLGKVRRAELRK